MMLGDNSNHHLYDSYKVTAKGVSDFLIDANKKSSRFDILADLKKMYEFMESVKDETIQLKMKELILLTIESMYPVSK